MKNKILTWIIILFILLPTAPTVLAEAKDDFRSISFDGKGYVLRYDIVQGDNLDNVFSDMGFNIKGSLSNAELHVILKNRKTVLQDVYLIEKDKFVPMYVTLFAIETHVLLKESLEIVIDSISDIILDLIDFNFQPVGEETINVVLPAGTSIVVPKIFTNITRPNFGSMLQNLDIFDFLPIVLDYDYTRFEAEFTALVLDQTFSVNVFNQGYDDFTVSLEANIEPAVSMKASWNKESGILESFSSHITFGNESTTLILALKDYEEIESPIDIPVIGFFINNSQADFELYQDHTTTEDLLRDWSIWVRQLNQTVGIQYALYGSGLDFDWNMRIYDSINHLYTTNTPIHKSWTALMPPILLPLWERFEGSIFLVQEVFTQLEDMVNGYQFELKGVTDTLYTIEKAELDIEYQHLENVHNVIWNLSIKYQGNNTQLVIPRVYVNEVYLNTSGWLAYSNEGLLKGFSHSYQEHFHSYYDPEETDKGNNYFFEYLIESNAFNLTIPSFKPELNNTSFSNIVQIVFYVLLVYFIWRKRRQKSEFM
ncbi:MAG: hypothetical protein ACTSQC_04270 [Candidatus Heimdallarchaeaceae archaeon]